MPIHLDNNATTRPTPEACRAVARGMETLWHNPSSVHRPGQDARHALELARAQLAALLGVQPRRLVITASGTESILLALRGTLAATRKRTLITTAVEHAAVRDLAEQLAHEGVTVKNIPLSPSGVAEPAALEPLLDDDAALVSVQWANNETGAIHPIADLARLCRSRSIPFHTDATQWVGKMPTDLSAPGAPPVDLLTASAHKFHGPKGVGLLYIAPHARLRPVMPGSQELGRRAGTENLPAILGAGVAAEQALAWLADPTERDRLARLRDAFESQVIARCQGAHTNPSPDCPRLWNTTNIAFPRLEAEALLMAFSERGLAASAGAACSSGSLDPSPVLLAMGVPPASAHGSVRFSLSRDTSAQELQDAADLIAAVVQRLAAVLPA